MRPDQPRRNIGHPQGQVTNDWQDVQRGRFSYGLLLANSRGTVRMILRGYLLAEVRLSC